MKVTQDRAYLLFSVAALFLYLWGFLGQTSLVAMPQHVLNRDSEYPAVVDGIEAATPQEARFLAEGYSPGATINIVFASGSAEEVTLLHAHSRGYLLSTLFSGLLFWWIGTFVFRPRTQNAAARALFWGTLLYGLAVMIGGIYFPRTPWTADLVRGFLQLTCLAALPVIFFHLAYVFPGPEPRIRPLGRLFPVLWVAAAAVAIWQEVAFLRYFNEPGPASAAFLAPPQRAADGFMVVLVLASLGLLFYRRQVAQAPRERSMLNSLLVGIGLGVTPYVFLRSLPDMLGIAPPLPPIFDRVFELAIPGALVFVVVRNRYLDIDIVVRRNLIYSALAAGALAVSLTVVGFITWAANRDFLDWGWLLVLGLGLIAGILYRPIRNGLGVWVDRTFFRIRHDAGVALGEFRGRLENMGDQESLARETRDFVREVTVVERAAVVLREQGSYVVAGDVPEDIEAWFDSASSLALHSSCAASPGSTNTPDLESSSFPDELIHAGYLLVTPIAPREEDTGLVLIGRKRTQRRFVEPDIAIVHSVAEAAASALARMRVVQQLEQVRLRNEFFSRVAHDLRTPLTSIGWSVQNMLDGVTGELAERQRQYLTRIRTSSDYLAHLTQNLLEVGRIDRGHAEVLLEDVDLLPVLESAGDTMAPIAAAKDARLHIERIGTSIVRADREKVRELAVNLIDNAVQYSPAGGTITVRVGDLDTRGCGFSVRDEGPGFLGVDPEQLFDSFRQGRTPPTGERGFGLGLYIVRTYMELMQGRVTGIDHPEGGALLTCTFPPPARAGKDETS